MAELSQALEEVLARFFTEREHFNQFLNSVTRQNLEIVMKELLDLYARDKNSSTLREFITITIADYKWRGGEKLGFNGWQGEGESMVWAEVKPNNLERTKGKKFNGSGSFNDFTPERFERYRKLRLNVLVSCFIDGELVLILEFPFNCPQFLSRCALQLERRFPGGRRNPGEYLRGLQFNWRHYKDCDVRLILLNRDIIQNEPGLFQMDFRNWLIPMDRAKHG